MNPGPLHAQRSDDLQDDEELGNSLAYYIFYLSVENSSLTKEKYTADV